VSARSRWPDERIDDLAVHVEGGIAELRDEMRALRSDMREEIRELRREIRENSRWQLGLHLTTLLGIAAIAIQTITR
jgi:hypothetical protein